MSTVIVVVTTLIMLTVGPACLAEELPVWIGTTTPRGGESRGIYRATLNTKSGKLTKPTLAAELDSPGFVALHPTKPVLYTLCKLPGGGGVASFHIAADGSLKPQSQQIIGDGGAAHLCVDQTGRCLFTAQYVAGSVAVFPLAQDGAIQSRSDLKRHSGSGPNKRRQTSPHPHWVGVGPNNHFLFVPDLGIDLVVIYRIDLEKGQLTRHGSAACPPGGGPRHMKFSPDGRFAYVLNELLLSVTQFRFDAKDGKLTAVNTVAALPAELQELPSTASEIRFHPGGGFLYTGNRGHDTISVFAVDQASGELTLVEREPVRGSWPRNFNVDPTGKWLLAAGRDSNTIAVFGIDHESGALTYSRNIVNCPTPICIEFGR